MLTKFGISRQIFIEDSNIKFHVNVSSERSADTHGRTEGHAKGRTNSLTPFQSNKASSWLYNAAGNNKTYLAPHVKYPIFLTDLTKSEL
jgi:hypothetical protein